MNDLKFAFRQLLKNPGFTAVAVLTLALVLLTTAGLMVRSFLHVLAVEPGFRSDSVLAFDVQLPRARYSGEGSQALFYQQLAARLEALPGVRAVGAISYLPLGGVRDPCPAFERVRR